jgi:hypothetical protein
MSVAVKVSRDRARELVPFVEHRVSMREHGVSGSDPEQTRNRKIFIGEVGSR